MPANPESLKFDQSDVSRESYDLSDKQEERLRRRTKELISEITELKPDVVVFMDKSARPLWWMLKAAWPHYSSGQVMPKIRFINVGTEKGIIYDFEPPTERDYPIDGQLDRAWLRFNEAHKGNDYFERAKIDLGKGFSGNFLIVDDFVNTGNSISITRNLFKHYFPQAKVTVYSFFRPGDNDVFPNPSTISRGPYLPWYRTRSLMVKENSDKSSLTASAEDDPQRKSKSLELRAKLEELFIQ